MERYPPSHRSSGTGTQVPRSAWGLTIGARRVTIRKITANPARTERTRNFIRQSLGGYGTNPASDVVPMVWVATTHRQQDLEP